MPAWLNQALIRLIHRRPNLNDRLPRCNNAKYISFIDVSSGYHKFKTRQKLIILDDVHMSIRKTQVQTVTIWSNISRGYFPKKIDEIFKDLPNEVGIADDILVAGYKADGKDHDKTVQRVLQRCRQGNLKLNKDKCYFRCKSVPFLENLYHSMDYNQTHKRSRPYWKIHPLKIKKNSRLFWVLIII